jgi:hypothetical protein
VSSSRRRGKFGVTEADIQRLPDHRGRAGLAGAGPLSRDAAGICEHMAGLGFSLGDIQAITGVRPGQLRWLKSELRAAIARKDLYVAESAYLQAVGGPDRDYARADPVMTRWWMERRRPEWRRPPDKLLGIGQNVNLDRLTDGELGQLERLLEVASGFSGGAGRAAAALEYGGGGSEFRGGEGEV